MQNINIENTLLIDIETVSGCKEFQLLPEDWKELWTEKIQKALPENISAEEFYPLRAGILAEFAKVICISIGYFRTENNQLQLRIKSFYAHDEKELLENFISTMHHLHSINNRWCFTGHNIKEFDVPFLCRRMLINNLAIPRFLDFQNMKPWETPVTDTLHLWRFGDYKHYTSLKLLAGALGVPSPKDDIDGSQVGEVYWEENDLERIVFYCQKDVTTVGNVILRFKGMPLLTPEQIVIVRLNNRGLIIALSTENNFMKKLAFFSGLFLLSVGLSNCSDTEYRYIDLNSGKPINVVKDSANGYMINSETKQPVIVYYDTKTKDTIFGTTGEVINNHVVKTADGKYEYIPETKTVVEEKDKPKTQEELDLEKLNKYGNYKKKVEGDGDVKIKEGDTKIKYDGKTGEKTVKTDK